MAVYCKNCGTKNEDEDFFCIECGTPLIHEKSEEQYTETMPQIKDKAACAGEKRKNPAGLKAVIAVICLAVICGGGYWGYTSFFQKTKVNLVNNMELSLIANDGDVILDTDGTRNSVSKTGIDESNADQKAFLNGVDYSFSKYNGIKAGDKITVTAAYDTDSAKALKLDVTRSSMTFTVKETPFRYTKGSDLNQDAYTRALNKAQTKVNKLAEKYDEGSVTFQDAGLFSTKADSYSTKSWKSCDNLCFLFEVSSGDAEPEYYVVSVYPFDLNTNISDMTIGNPYPITVNIGEDAAAVFEHSTDRHDFIPISSDTTGE